MIAMIRAEEICDYLRREGFSPEFYGESGGCVSGVCSLSALQDFSLTWCKKVGNCENCNFNNCSSVILVTGEFISHIPSFVRQIVVTDPKASFFSAVRHFFCLQQDCVISSKAIVETENIGRNVAIGNFSYVGPDVKIADDVVIGHHVIIECRVAIGTGSIIGSGTVIGTEGYGYYADSRGRLQRVPHLGGVEIGEYVELGANVTIDRGTLGNTVIGDYVKVNNLCHIAHNVHIGRGSMLAAGVVVCGSADIAEECYLAPGALIVNQSKVGQRALVGMGAVAVRDVEDEAIVVGNPARFLRSTDQSSVHPAWKFNR